MSKKRYPEESKIEAIKQITERGYKVSEVATRLGAMTKSLQNWIRKYGEPDSQHETITSQQDVLRQLKADLRRITEERDVLKEATAFFANESRNSTRS